MSKIFACPIMQNDTPKKLLDALAPELKPGAVVAIKVDFTRPCPPIIQALYMALAERGASPFLADCSVPYGYAGAPCVLADGVKGTDYDLIPVRGGKLLRSAKFGRAITDADLVITVTAPDYDDHGYRGVLYDLGMGCAARAGKTEVQTSGKPVVDQDKCVGCSRCAAICEHGGARLDAETRKATIFPPKCSGCGRCMRICPVGAIHPNFDVSDVTVMSKIAEYAKALCDARPHLHIALLDQAYAAQDSTALDALCAERMELPEQARAGIAHAASLGFGEMEYELT